MSETASKPRQPLLPELVRRPHMLLWTWALPIGLLLLLNYRAWYLAEGEMNDEQHALALLWGGLNLANLIGGLLVAGWHIWKRREMRWPTAAVLLILQSLFLWFCSYHVPIVLPNAVTGWIVTQDHLLFQQWTWIMPSAFYAVLILAGFPIRLSRGREIGLSLVAIVMGPASIYLLGWLLLQTHSSFAQFAGQVFIVLFIGATLLMGLGVVRLLILLFTRTLHGEGRSILGLVVLFALIMPLGGLALNMSIPFPADYQDPWIYCMVVLNTLFLLVPDMGNRSANFVIFLGRWLLLPFTLYFFLVFLPYLPLAIPAVLAIGSGFLILTPTVLFIVHLMQLRDAWRFELPIGRVGKISLALLAVAALPAAVTVEAWHMGRQLEKGLNWVYAPDTASSQRFQGNPNTVVEACLWLRDYKNGRYLPYLTPYRSWLMFDGQVLSDDKLKTIYSAFSGQSLDMGTEESEWSFGLFNDRSSNRDAGRMSRNSPPTRNSILQALSASTSSTDGIANSTLTLSIQNPTQTRQSEYLTHFTLPEGVVVSGFWLHIGEERVLGKLFEKKTALWVYQMITNQRRDPGLLFYTGPNELQLQVFPLAPKEMRTVELELSYPAGLVRSIEIDGQQANLGGIERVAVSSENVAVLNKPALDELPLIQRQPYWHVIVDWSAQGPDLDSIQQALAQIQALGLSTEKAIITEANFESLQINESPLPLNEISSILQSDWPADLPRVGGFLPARAIMQAMLDYEHNSLRKDADYDHYPLFVILTNKSEHTWTDDLRPFAGWTPEARGVLVATPESLTARDWLGRTMDLPELEVIPPVGVLALGKSVRPVRYGPWTAELDFSDQGELRFLESEHRTFVPMGEFLELPKTNPYAQALALRNDSLVVERNPAALAESLPTLVAQSKKQGVLIPQTSYIVVENSAQWRMLERTEKDKLKGNPELDIMETPEPSVWILGGLLLAIGAAHRRLKGSLWRQAKITLP